MNFQKDILPPLSRWLQSSDKIAALRRASSDLLDRNVGLLLVTLAQLFFCCMNLMVKMLTSLDDPVPTTQLIAVRMVITCACCIGWMVHAGIPDPVFGPSGVRGLLILRGVLGFFGLFGTYYGLQYLSLSDSTVIGFLQPPVAAFLGYIILKEVYSRNEAASCFISFCGVILIARPTFLFNSNTGRQPPSTSIEARADHSEPTEADRFWGVAVQLLGVIVSGATMIVIRAIGTRSHAMHSIVYFSFYSVVVSSSGAIIFRHQWVLPGFAWTGGMLMIGCFGFIAQYLATMGYQREQAGRGSLGIYVQIIFATIFERIFFRVSPSLLSIIGAAMIMCSAVFVALTKKREKPETIPATPEEEVGLVSGGDHDAEEIELQVEEGRLLRPQQGKLRRASSSKPANSQGISTPFTP